MEKDKVARVLQVIREMENKGAKNVFRKMRFSKGKKGFGALNKNTAKLLAKVEKYK